MALTIPQQIHQLIQDKKHILVTGAARPDTDVVAGAMAFLAFLKKLGKVVDVVFDAWTPTPTLSFLKDVDSIQPSFSYLQKFIVTLDVKNTGVQELSYDLKDEKLRIFVTPKQRFLTRDDVRTAQTDFKYDLIVVLGTTDLESLGALYDNNTELFYKTPIVNIDHHPANEHFGQVNLVDLTATATTEVLFDLLKKLGEEYIDPDMATALLTGMIAKTRSFKTDNVKPYTLATAGKLMNLGANREQIVHHLFRTRSIATLKLWGFTLTHMQTDAMTGLVWSTLTRDDFVRSGASEHDLRDIIDELISSSPQAKVILLLHEHEHNGSTNIIHGLIHTEKQQSAKMLALPYAPKGTDHNVSFIVTEKSLKTVEEEMVREIISQLHGSGTTTK